MTNMLINKVAQSGIITLDLEDFFPKEEVQVIDLKDFLFKGLILKEKEFRAAVKEYDWISYRNKTVAVGCSTDAILPQWAYMLLVSYLSSYTAEIYYGSKESVEYALCLKAIISMETESYLNAKVVIKGCGKHTVTGEVYVELTKKLQPVVQSLMFGEPCSTVPIFKKKEQK